MSSAEWIFEASTGRYWRSAKDSSGRSTREYYNEAGAQSSSAQPRDAISAPRGEFYPDPESQSYQQDRYASSSTRDSYSGGHQRRTSVSYGRDDAFHEQSPTKDRRESVGTYNESSSRYRPSGGSASSRERNADIGDGLQDDLGALTVNDAVGYDTYYTAGSSAPLAPLIQSSPSVSRNFPASISDVSTGIAASYQPYSSSIYAIPSTSYDSYNGVYATPPTNNNYGEGGQREESQRDEIRDTKSRKGKGAELRTSNSPSTQVQSGRYIKGTPHLGDMEKLDKNYRLRKTDYKKFFRQGRVFQTLWTDPIGDPSNELSEIFQSENAVITKFGERVYTKIRRFVVLQQTDRVCTCLPVTTYNGNGWRKTGIRLEQHGQIYSDRVPEMVMGNDKKALKVNLSKGAVRITEGSLINYGAVYTVETNVKVKDVGELDSASRKLLRHYFNEVMTLKYEYNSYGQDEASHIKEATLTGVGVGIQSGTSDYSANTSPPGRLEPLQSSSSTKSRYPPKSQFREPAPYISDDSGRLASDAVPKYNTPIESSPSGNGNPQYYTTQRYSTVDTSPNYYRNDSRDYGAVATATSNSAGYSPSGNTSYYGRDPANNPGVSGPGAIPSGQLSGQDYRDVSNYYSADAPTSAIPVYASEPASSSSWLPRVHSLASQAGRNSTVTGDIDDIYFPPGAEIHVAHHESGSNASRLFQFGRRRQSDIDRDHLYELETGPHNNNDVPPLDEHNTSLSTFESQDNSPPIPELNTEENRASPITRLSLVEKTNPQNEFGPGVDSNSSENQPEISVVTTTKQVTKLQTEEIRKDDLNTAWKSLAAGMADEDFTEPSHPDEDLQPSRFNLSRSSSVESLESILSVAFSASSASSLASQVFKRGKRLVTVLSNDEELRALYEEALKKVSFVKFEENFRRCLLQFAAHLQSEAMSSTASQVARVIRRLSRRAAKEIRELCESEGQANTSTHEPHAIDNSNDDSDSSAISDTPEDAANEPEDLEDFETDLTSSNSFQMLRENLRLFVYPDPVLKALFKIWPASQSRDLAMAITYSLQWEVPKLLRNNFPKWQNIRNVLTLTGNSLNAQASSCENYLMMTWPNTGSLILKALESVLPSRATVFIQDANARIWLRNTRPLNSQDACELIIKAQATHAIHRELISALSWVSSALRESSFGPVSFSSASIQASVLENDSKIGPLMGVAIRAKSLKPLEPTGACWHSLFPRAVIVEGFPIKERKQGVGLEISFADMAFLSGSLSMVEFDNGLVVNGLKSLLIPVAKLSDDDAFQWHFEPKARSSRLARVSQILTKVGKWYKEVQPQLLVEKRCFLGWTDDVHILVGTRHHSDINIGWSSSTTGPQVRHVRSHNITFGTGGMGYITATGTLGWTPTSVPASFATSQVNKDLYDILEDGVDDSVLVYDTGTRICWCLPQSSVVLLIAHQIIKRCRYKVFDKNAESSLGLASPSADGAFEASKVMRKGFRLKIRKYHSADEYTTEDIASLFTKIWQMLDDIGTGLESAQPGLAKVKELPPEYIHGVEFCDVLKRKGTFAIRKSRVHQQWARLTRRQPTVIFCRGFAQAIAPSCPETLCRSWGSVPPAHNIMVATTSAIQWFLDQHDEALAENLEWCIEGALLQTHQDGQTTSVLHTQGLRFVRSLTRTVGIQTLVATYPTGCFLFTDYNTRRYCYEKLSASKARKYLPPDSKPLPEVPKLEETTYTNSGNSSVATEVNEDSEFSNEESQLYFSVNTTPELFQPGTYPVKTIQESKPQLLIQDNETTHRNYIHSLESTMNKTGPAEYVPLDPTRRIRKKSQSTNLGKCYVDRQHEESSAASCRSHPSNTTFAKKHANEGGGSLMTGSGRDALDMALAPVEPIHKASDINAACGNGQRERQS